MGQPQRAVCLLPAEAFRRPTSSSTASSGILTRKKTPTASGDGTRSGSEGGISMQDLGFELDGQRRRFNDFYEDGLDLGRGGTCTAMTALPRSGGPIRAVKIVDVEERRLVMREASMLQRLDHPRVCRLVDLFSEDDALYMVLQRIEGKELFTVINESRLQGQYRHCALIARQLLEALEYCHSSAGVVHRDLKPENIMVTWEKDSEPEATLIDFGSAVEVGKKKAAVREAFGTEPYMAPEAEDCNSFQPSLDMWSFGAVLHTMLTKTCLDSGLRTDEQDLQEPAKRYEAAWARCRVPPAARSLLRGLLKRQPEQRLTAAEALQHPWILGECPDEEVKEEQEQGLEAEPSAATAVDAADEEPSPELRAGSEERSPPSPGYGQYAEEEEWGTEEKELKAITRMVEQFGERKIRLLHAFCLHAQVAEDGSLEAEEVRRCAALAGLDAGDLDTLVLLSARRGQALEVLLGGQDGASLYSQAALLACLEVAAEVAANPAAADANTKEEAPRPDATGNVACEGFSSSSPGSSRRSSASGAAEGTCVKEAMSDKSTSPGTTPRWPGQGLGLESPEDVGQDSAQVFSFALLENRQAESEARSKRRGRAASHAPLQRQHNRRAAGRAASLARLQRQQRAPATPTGSRTELTAACPRRGVQLGRPPRSL